MVGKYFFNPNIYLIGKIGMAGVVNSFNGWSQNVYTASRPPKDNTTNIPGYSSADLAFEGVGGLGYQVSPNIAVDLTYIAIAGDLGMTGEPLLAALLSTEPMSAVMVGINYTF